MIKKILLIRPLRPYIPDKTGREIPFPLGLGYLAAAVEDLCNITVLDLETTPLDDDALKEKIRTFAPDLVGISNMFTEYRKEASNLARLVACTVPDSIIVMGGSHVTSMPELVFSEDPSVDYLFIGESEVSFRKFILKINTDCSIYDMDGFAWRKGDKICINPKVKFIKNLDMVRSPAWHLFNMNSYITQYRRYFWRPRQIPYTQLFTSRGCPAHCVFCTSRKLMGKGYRAMSAERVLEDMEFLINTYGIREFMFYDDNFTFDRKRIIDVCKGIIKRKWSITWFPAALAVYAIDKELMALMKASGCYRITLAIESGSDRVLKHVIHKPINTSAVRKMVALSKSFEMEIIGLFVIGLPGETMAEIRCTVDFAEELDLDFFILSIATPYPGSTLYDICKEEGYLVRNFTLDQIGTSRAVISTPEFSPYDLEVIRRRDWLRILFDSQGRKERIMKLMGLSFDEVNQWAAQVRKDLERVHKKYGFGEVVRSTK